MVERNNRMLGDALLALLLRKGSDEWDTLLPQLMQAFSGTPHVVTDKTANFLMFGRELQLPDKRQWGPPPDAPVTRNEYAINIQARLTEAHKLLREQQLNIRQTDSDEPPLYTVGDLVLLENKRRRKGEHPKLRAKFVGPYRVVNSFPNHTYEIEARGQTSIQNECRLKLYRGDEEELGKAPGLREPALRPNMKGATRKTKNPHTNPELPPAMEVEQDTPRRSLTELEDILPKQDVTMGGPQRPLLKEKKEAMSGRTNRDRQIQK
ncbi:uncharacterized protein [Watersipora subatra]|uniref:uncharacterized protein n=1 Tax=Watersipora subatra TaxID=2589382 RepID=UPI00355BA71A